MSWGSAGLRTDSSIVRYLAGAVALSTIFYAARGIENYESPAQTSRRPEVVKVLRARSRKSCPESSNPGAADDYDARFADVMEHTHESALELYAHEGTIICLDSRLAHQESGFFDKKAIGVYYPAKNVISLYDNGRTIGGFFKTGSGSYSEEMLEDLAAKIGDGKIPTDQVSLAARYSCGKHCTTTKWKPAKDFNAGTQEKNPWIGISPTLPHFEMAY